MLQQLLPATLGLTAGLILGGVAAWLWQRGRLAVLGERLSTAETERASCQALRDENAELRSELAHAHARHDADVERLAWIHTAEEQLRGAFQSIAGDLLERSSAALQGEARRNDGARDEMWRQLTAPVEDGLARLGGEIRELEKARQGAYEGLQREIGLLRDAHRDLRRSAHGLERALRSPTVRGRWGEVQLRRVVELAGMVEHVDFVEQVALPGGQRPDLVVELPNGRRLAIDAKTPMNAYLEALDAPEEGARRDRLQAHARALHGRANELGARRYWERLEGSPDFVVMFVPNEASLGAAFEHDPDLFEHALGRRVLPATPVTLLALLKAVACGWRENRLGDGARRVGEAGRELHEKLNGFLDHLRRLGRGLDASVAGYNQLVGALERRVIPAAEHLADVGAGLDELSSPERLPGLTRPPRGAG